MDTPTRAADETLSATALLCLAAALSFVPDTLEFLRLGIPDILFTGDGAALELGTLHAAHGRQLVGPYSRFGWNHPGPAVFYLALPVYEVFQQRGPALNVFAFVVNGATAIAIVLTARQLRGTTFAFLVAGFLSIYALVGVPFLLANEWNPILPILPLGLLSLLAARLSLGACAVLPAFAFVGSTIVQTHVGYAPAVFALCVFAFVRKRRFVQNRATDKASARPWMLAATIGVLFLCWILPLYEAVVGRPGNLPKLVGFFLFSRSAQPSWNAAVATVIDQLAVMPWALAQGVSQNVIAAPRMAVAAAIALAEIVGVAILLVVARRRNDPVLITLATLVLMQAAVAILAVRSIRGEILFYLVTWVSLIGLLSLVAAAAWCVPALEQVFGAARTRVGIGVGAAVLIGLALAGPVPRSAVIRQPDVQIEQLARDVEAHLRAAGVDHPTIRIASHETWPTAVAVVLHLHKKGVPIFVEREWLSLVGKPLAEAPGRHSQLFFGNQTFADQALQRRDLSFVARTDRVSVFIDQ